MNAAARELSRLVPSPSASKDDRNLASTGSTPTSIAFAPGIEDRLRPHSAEMQRRAHSSSSTSTPPLGPVPSPRQRASSAAAAKPGSSKQAVSLAKRLSERGRPGLCGGTVNRAPVVTRLPGISGIGPGQVRSSKRQSSMSPRICFENLDPHLRSPGSKQVHFPNASAASEKHDRKASKESQCDDGAAGQTDSQNDNGAAGASDSHNDDGVASHSDSKKDDGAAEHSDLQNDNGVLRQSETMSSQKRPVNLSTEAQASSDSCTSVAPADPPAPPYHGSHAGTNSTLDVGNARKLFQHIGIPGAGVTPEKIERLDRVGVKASGQTAQALLPETETGLLHGDEDSTELLIATLWNAALHSQGDNQFSYARCRDSIYDIEVLPFSSCPRWHPADALQIWVTISSGGMTFHTCDEKGKQVEEEFVSLDDWVADRKKFLKLQRLRWCKMFPLRRNFKQWQHSTVHKAHEAAAEKLENNLLVLRPKYYKTMLWLQTFCQTRLPRSAIVSRHCRGRQSITVFRRAIEAGREEAAVRVAELDEEVQLAITKACDEIFQEALENEFQGPLPTRRIRQRPFIAENALGIPGHKLTQTGRVHIRSECQRICRLVRLSNFMLKNQVQHLCRQEIFRILDAVNHPQSQISSSSHFTEGIVFIVKVGHDSRNAEDSLKIGLLTLETDTETTCQVIHEAMNGLVETLQLFKKLPCNPEFVNYAEVADDRSVRQSNVKRVSDYDGNEEVAKVLGPREFWPGFCFDGNLLSEETISHGTSTATAIINDAFLAAKKHLGDTEGYIANFQKLRISDASQIGKSEDPVAELEQQIRLYLRSISHFNGMPAKVKIGVLELDMTLLLQRIVNVLRDSLRGFALVLPKLVGEKTQIAACWVDDSLELVRMDFPEILKEFVYFLKRVRVIRSEVSAVRHVKQQLEAVLHLADENKLAVGKDNHAKFDDFSNNFTVLSVELQQVEGVINKKFSFFVGVLETVRPRLMEKLQDLFEEVLSPNLLTLKYADGQLDPCSESPSQIMLDPECMELEIHFMDVVEETDVREKLQVLNDLSPKFASLTQEVSEYSDQQDALFVRNNACQKLLENANAEFLIRQKLWNCISEWHENLSRWGGINFHDLDVHEIAEVCCKLSDLVGELPASSMSQEMKGRMKIMQVACDILQTLQNASLKERHWEQFAKVLNAQDKEVQFKEGIPFSDLMDLGLLSASTEVEELCHKAAQEDAIDQQLQMLHHKWRMIRLQTKAKFPGLDDLFLANAADIMEEVDDSFMMISALATSPFAGPFMENVMDWQQDLSNMEETLEFWAIFESSWSTVRPVLVRGDSASLVDMDSESFDKVNTWYKQLMQKVGQESFAMQALLEPGRCAEIKEHSLILEQMHIDLDSLMETKRRRCPRLYFVGSSDVVEMMRDQQFMVCMQPHIRKCFASIDNIVLEVRENDEASRQDSGDLREGKSDVAIAMTSAQGETLYWGRVRHDPKLENFLLNIQEAMVRVLRRQCWLALGSLRGEASDSSEALLEWMLSEDYCAQANVTAALVSWCRDIEVMFSQQEVLISLILEQHKSSLETMARALDRDLKSFKRLGILAHITVNLFCRDVLEFLRAARVSRSSSFEWQRQQRWYWDVGASETFTLGSEPAEMTPTSQGPQAPTGSSGDLGLCMKQIAFEFSYGYEYYDVTHRIVITPLTERCWLTITQAIANKYGAVLLGPPGTGKTESAKDLAKSLGVQCIVFNCGAETDSKISRRLLSGLVQSGAWLCLNEFDCIEVDVLGVMASQILSLRVALLASQRKVDFEGQIIPVHGHLGLVVTVNPGLVGRQELPDNIKVLFRPAAMVKPDFEYVACISLQVEQFKKAKVLAKRLALLYLLASRQLGRELHYDFGLRQLRKVLAQAVHIRSRAKGISEEVAVVRALQIVNIPRLVVDDKALFHDLVSDIFKDASYEPDSTELTIANMSSQVIQDQGLEPSEQLCRKVFQIHQTLHMQTGIMLVGPSGSGKSTSLKCFAEVEHKLATEEIPGFNHIEMKMVNHKVFGKDELYGTVSSLNSQWKDGLLPHFLRNQMRQESTQQCVHDRKCTFVMGFDGPVDPGWTEEMNTLLDDNRTLCLASAERLLVSSNVHILFETEDLMQASPAIVSKCGFVHFCDQDIGWQSSLAAWEKQRLPELASWANEEDLNYMRELFQKLPSALELRMTWSKPSATAPSIQVMSSFTHLLEAVFDSKPREGEPVNPGRMMDTLQGVVASERAQKQRKTTLDLSKIAKINEGISMPNAPFNTKRYLGVSFTFALAWSVASTNNTSERSDFQRWCFRHVPNFVLPIHCNVHDAFVDWSCEPQYLRPWNESIQAIPRLDPAVLDEVKIPTTLTVTYGFLGIILNLKRRHVILDGCKGCGKSLIGNNILHSLWNDRQWSVVGLNFIRNIKTRHVQDVVEQSHERTAHGFKAPKGKQVFIHIDDVNMPASDAYGCQCSLEVLRQLIDKEGFYDRQRWLFRSVMDTVLLLTPSPAAASEEAQTRRLKRLFTVLSIPSPSLEGAASIFAPILRQFFSFALPDGTAFSRSVNQLHENFCFATSEIYQTVTKELKPTPAHFYYSYSLCDQWKVIRGMLLAHPSVIESKTMATRLWAHEVLRVFGDRISGEQHNLKFSSLLSAVLNKRFGTEWHPALESVPLRFTFLQFASEEDDNEDDEEETQEKDHPQNKGKFYHELSRDEQQVGHQLHESLDEYNMIVKPPLGCLALVFFSAAISHIIRVHRIMLEPAGHVMCLGLPGTGKRSLALFAAFLAQSPAALPGYGENEVQRLLKEVLIGCGLRSERKVVLFTDNHFGEADSIVDIVNSLLRSGDVGTAWTSDERDLICAKLMESKGIRINLMSSTRNASQEESNDASNVSPSNVSAENVGEATMNRHMLWRKFVSQAHKWFHVMLCCSPAGARLRNMCRCYPGLLGSCTVDWFSSWPEEALFAVSLHFFSDSIDLGLETARKVCDQVHVLTEAACVRFEVEQKRNVYICPQTYIEFLDMFMEKHREKAEEIENKLAFLHAGQNKMEDSKAAIKALSMDIARLEPKLQEHAELTKALIEKVVRSKDDAKEMQSLLFKEREIFDDHAQAASARSAEAKAELAKAEPMYRQAVAAINNLDKRSIQELRVMLDPPPLVLLVLQCVCMLLGQEDDWAGARALLGDLSLIRRLKNFDKDNIPDEIAEKLKTYVNMPDFEPNEIGKQSKAAKDLSLWCFALSEYHEMKCALDQKVAHMRGLDRKLEEMKQVLGVKENAFGSITDRISEFERKHVEAEQSLQDLHAEMETCRVRRARASELMEAMKDEAKRWAEKEKKLEEELQTLPGDVVLSAAFDAYMGPFTQEFRKDLMSQWTEVCEKEGVALSANLKFQSLYVEPSTVYDWQINGLPADANSADSAVLVMHSPKWPYIIDPQQQASMWLRKQEQKNALKELKMTDQNILKTIRYCLKTGRPVLLDDCAEDFPTALDPVLMPVDVQEGMPDSDDEEGDGLSGSNHRKSSVWKSSVSQFVPPRTSNLMKQSSFGQSGGRQSSAVTRLSKRLSFGQIDAALEEGMKAKRDFEKPSWSGVGRFKEAALQITQKKSVAESEHRRFSLGMRSDTETAPFAAGAARQSVSLKDGAQRQSVRFSVAEGQQPSAKRRSSGRSRPSRSSFSRLSMKSLGASSVRNSIRSSIVSNSRCSVCLGDESIPLDATFRLYMLTSIANPHVNPRLSIMLNLVNFAINLEGLTAQLLCEVLKVEAPDLEAEHLRLLRDHSNDLKELEECEFQILSKLCDAETVDLLDNQDLVVTLQTSVRIRRQLQGRLQDEERREAKFASTCDTYKSIAEHGALVYMSVLAMGDISPLYVVPLSHVIKCFVATTTEFKLYAEANDVEKWNFVETETGQQVDGLNDDYLEEIQTRVMHSIFMHASRILFLQDRLVLSFIVCVNLSLHKNEMTKQHYDIFIRGSDVLMEISDEDRKKGIKETRKHGNVSQYTPDASIISNQSWELVRTLAILLPDSFVKLPADIISNIPKWRERLPLAVPGQRLIETAREAVEEAAEEADDDSRRSRSSTSYQVRMRKSVMQEQFGVSICCEFPAPWNSLFIEPFEQVLLVRALTPQHLMHGISGFVYRHLGPQFVETPPLRFEDVYYKESDCRTPLLISLMPGADPTSSIMDLAKSVRLESRNLHMCCMAHDQNSKTLHIMYGAVADGGWVLLQNCHLAQKWLTPLVSYVMKIVSDSDFTVHRRFRLFITTQAFPDFPMALLQCSLKVAFERPRGVRSRLLRNVRILSTADEWFTFKKGGAPPRNRLMMTAAGTIGLQLAWRRLLYGLTLFHAVVSERSSFKSRGFTSPYAFDDADFIVAREVLRIVYRDLPQDLSGTAESLALRISASISWPSLLFVMSEIVYGGRVNDDWDRRCVRISLQKFLYKDLLTNSTAVHTAKRPLLQPGQRRGRRQAAHFKSGTEESLRQDDFPSTIEKRYRLPDFVKAETLAKTYDLVVKSAESLPDEEPPELFGLSPQAEVLLQHDRSCEILDKLQVIHFHGQGTLHQESSPARMEGQPFGAGTQDDAVLRVLRMLRDELPPLQDHHKDQHHLDELSEISSQDDSPGSRMRSPQFVFLQHEKDCAHASLRLVHASLAELEEALNGHIPMNHHVDNLRLAVLRNQVPPIWLGKRWEPERSLMAWVKNLSASVKYFRSWNRKFETPICFLINAFYNPRGFLTTILQQEARKRAISLDTLAFRHKVKTAFEEPADIQEAPKKGIYLFGMWISGASWDTVNHVVDDLRSHNQSCCLMPVIQFIPEVDYKPDLDVVYRAPCYQTTSGNGQVDTTGQSSNLVTVVDLPLMNEDGSDKWILRGVTLICQPDE